MALVTDSMLTDIFILVIPIIYLIYWIITRNDDYWDKKGVPNIKRGLILDTLTGRKSQVDAVLDMDKQFPGEKYFGTFQLSKPVLWVRDPDLIQKVLVKDFTHFQDRGNPQSKNDNLSQNLFGLRGHIWRSLRYKLTPTFTTGKLRRMFEQLSQCGDNMMRKIEELANGKHELESKPFFFEFTLDVISSCAFGVQFKPGSPDFELFNSYIQKIFTLSPILFFKTVIVIGSPKLAEYLGLRQFSKEMSDYFLNLFKTTSKYRKDNNIKRDDYFQLLLTLQEQEESGKDLGLQLASDVSEDDAVIDQMRYTEQNSPQQPDHDVKCK